MHCSTKTFNTTRGFVGLGWAIFCPKGTLALRGVFFWSRPKSVQDDKIPTKN